MNLILVVGMTGQGKTKWTSQMLGNGFKPNPNNPRKSLQIISDRSRRQYIFDINNEYIFPDDLKYSPQMRHIAADKKKFTEICKTLKNTNIVFEDATGFLRGRMQETWMQLIYGKIHTGNNFIVLFHSLRAIPPELMSVANLVVLFRTIDNIDEVNHKFRNNVLTAAYKELQSSSKKQFIQIKLIN